MYNSNHDPEFEERFQVRLCEAYGLTEVGLTHYTRFPERRPGSCGRTHEDWEARVVDERGMAVQDGEVGEIVLRPRLPAIMMDGYINKADETLRATRDLWFHTGDYGRRDADGYYYFVSRAKERIRRRGENITPSEVERIIAGHPAIADCAALAHPARDGEDDVRVVVVARDPSAPPAPSALMDWLQGRMPYFMMPRYIEFAAELPRNPAGKLEKYKLLDAGLASDTWDREVEGYVIQRGTRP
jgi:crotonobetaine/carnitine-CoA ligase